MRIVSHQYYNFVTYTGDICLKRCVQAMYPSRPLPKLKMKRSQHGLMTEVNFYESELNEDDSRKSREQDVIDLCDALETSGTLQERHRPKTFEDDRTGISSENTPENKLFKVSTDLN